MENRKDDIVQAITDELGAPLSLSERVHYQMGKPFCCSERRIR